MIFSIVSMVDLSAYANESNTDNNDIDKMFNSYVNKADDFNFLEYVAQHYTSDKIKNIINFRTNEKTNTQNMVDYLNNNSLFQISYAEWEAATFITDPSEVVSKNLDKETYYETILLRIINSSVSSDNAIDWLNQGAIKNSVKILKNMTKAAETDYYACLADRHILISDLTETEINKINEFSKNYLNSQSYKVFGKDLDFISDVLSISKDIEQYSEKLASYCQLIELGDAVADFLNEIGKNTNDKYLKKAIDRIVPIIKDSYISMLNNAVSDGILNIGVTAMKKIVGDTWKKSLINLLNNGVLFNGTVIVNSAFLAIGVTKLIGNIAFSVDAKLDKYELMKALCSFEESMSETINNLLNDYQQNDNYSNLLLESVAIIYQAYIVDTELQTEAINLCKKDWIKFVSNKDLDELLEISKNNKATYQDEYNSITIKSGSCGENTYWVITDENELIIYGIGNTNDYTSTTMPWYENLLGVQSVYISSYINKIGAYFLYGLSSVSVPIMIMNNILVSSHNFDDINTEILVYGALKVLGSNKVLNNLTINGSFTIDFVTCTFTVSEGATLNVNNSMLITGGSYNYANPILDVEGTVNVNGNVEFANEGRLKISKDSGVFNIGGNFTHCSYGKDVTAGTIKVKGNIKSYTPFSGTNTLILNGDKLQTINASNFSVLEIRNLNGVTFNKSINVSKLFNHNGNPFTLYNDGKGSVFVDYDNDCINDNLDPYPIQNHEFYEIERVNPTCTNDGYYIAHCDKCNQNKRVILKKLEHTYVLSKHTDSTCNTSGYDEYKCTVCGNTYRDEIAVLDGSALTASLEKAQTYLAKDYFTNESMAVLQNVYDSHINDLDTLTTQMAVDNAATEINTAINELVLGDYASGETDDGISWEWERCTGVLTVSGTGSISGYTSTTMPWYDVINYTTEIVVSDGITTIGKYAFYKAENVQRISLPGTLTTISERAFEYCSSIEELLVPDSVTSIGYGTFANMTNLKKVTVPASTTYRSYCFDNDKAIEEIKITYGVDGIIPVANVTAEQSYILDVFYKRTGSFGPWKYAENAVVKIESGVSEIGDQVFYYCSGIENIELPDTVTEIGTGNFVGADAATEITILNPNCTIQEGSFTSSNTIIGYLNSTAEVFANNNSIPFKAIDGHIHAYGEWTYNGDAEYVSSSDYKNGTQTRVCSVCGKEETIEAPNTALLRRRGNALALESSITLTTYITKDVVDYYDEVYAEFTRNGKTETVYASDKTFKSGSTVYNIFDYAGISPQAMGDDIEIKFYGIKDGVKYWGETYTYSVTTYVTSTLSKSTTSAKLKTMLVDLMYYGAACQIYQNYKTDSLMTNVLTDEQKKLRSTGELNLTNIKDSSYATCKNRLVRFGTALRLNNAVELAIPLNMTNVTLEELSFKVKIGSRDLTYTYSDNPENFEKGKDGYWYFYFDGVYANQMSDEVFITAYRGDEQVSYTLKYSVESYAATVTDSKLKKVTDAMMRYGNSAKAYSG